MPFWEERISTELEKGKNVLVVSHGNTIRALVKQIESISDRDIENFEIGTARPLLYEIDESMIFECKGYLAPSPASFEEDGKER
jgi:2,3-bisphosphoglycerate-dependent phosphoglycerate mutase